MQLNAFAAQQLDSGQANRVRTSRRSGRKHSMRPIVRGRRTDQFGPTRSVPTQFELRGTIKLPDDDEMRETLNVSKPRSNSGSILSTPSASCLAPRPLGTSLASLYGLLTNPIGRGVNIRDNTSGSHTNVRRDGENSRLPSVPRPSFVWAGISMFIGHRRNPKEISNRIGGR